MKKSLIAITGASAGIGTAIARRFAKEGFPVVLLARRLERLEALQKELGKSAFAFEMDVADAKSVEKNVQRIEQEAGPIGVWVNNAGVAFGLEPAFQGKKEDWDQMVETNIQGLLACTRAVLPKMVERNSG